MTNEQLARRIRAGENEAENMKTLWIQCRAFVAKMARKYSGYAEMDDLMQEGFLGLCDAMEHYEPEEGTKFLSYAGFWIKAAMQRCVERSGSVRLPSDKYTMIWKYRRALREYMQEYGREPSAQDMAVLLGIGKEDADALEKLARSAQSQSLNEYTTEDESLTLEDSISSGEDLEEDAIRKEDHGRMSAALWESVEKLPREQALVIAARFRDQSTLQELADKKGCTFQAVRSLEQKGMRTLRRPGTANKYRLYFDQYIAAAPVRHVGIESFKRTGYSEVERAVLGYGE